MARVVIGSAAVEHPEVVDELATLHPGQVAVGLDARGRDVAIHGWTEATGLDLVDARAAVRPAGRGRDHRRPTSAATACSKGPTPARTADLLDAIDIPVIASGGVGTLDDIRGARPARLAGVIVGRAIYENRFTVEEGIAACSQSA